MPAQRTSRFAERGPTVRRSIADLLVGRSWALRGNCVGMERLHDGESVTASRERDLSSATDLARLVVCSSCPVIVECLRDALEPRFGAEHLTPTAGELEAGKLTTVGAWGGTLDHDRWLLRHLPPAETEALLLASLPERLALRVRAWSERLALRPTRSWTNRLIAERLGIELPPLPGPCTTCNGLRYSGQPHRRCALERVKERTARARAAVA